MMIPNSPTTATRFSVLLVIGLWITSAIDISIDQMRAPSLFPNPQGRHPCMTVGILRPSSLYTFLESVNFSFE